MNLQYEPSTYNEYNYEEYQDYPVEEYDQEEEVLYTTSGQPYRRTNNYVGRNEGLLEGPRDQNDRQRCNRRDPDPGFSAECSTCKSMSNSAITMAVEEILEVRRGT